MALRVAIVGRPNVGKSTLFNRLAGRRAAIVDPRPGMTRDRNLVDGRIGSLRFELFDTPGIEEADPDTVSARMSRQSESAMEDSDLVLFVTDGRDGLTALDRSLANRVRARAREVVVVVNKCEGAEVERQAVEAFELGLGEPVPISAEHGLGMAELADVMADRSEDGPETDRAVRSELRLAVIGRPNVGKSTLVNRLLGEERMVTGPEPGLTRDAVRHRWTWKGRTVELADTAGLARRMHDRTAVASARSTRGVLRLAEVAVLMIDGTEEVARQDLAIAREVADEGRALVVAVNKWDRVRRRRTIRSALSWTFREEIPEVRNVPWVCLSARTGMGIERLMESVFDIRARWELRVPTSVLNRWLGDHVERHPPPRAGGRAQRLRFMTQTNVRPPTFALFANHPAGLPPFYVRYLANGLRDSFGLDGVPLRIMLRKGNNPYVSRSPRDQARPK